MVGIIFLCMDSFLLSVLEGRYMESFVGYFHGNEDEAGGTCVGLAVE